MGNSVGVSNGRHNSEVTQALLGEVAYGGGGTGPFDEGMCSEDSWEDLYQSVVWCWRVEAAGGCGRVECVDVDAVLAQHDEPGEAGSMPAKDGGVLLVLHLYPASARTSSSNKVKSVQLLREVKERKVVLPLQPPQWTAVAGCGGAMDPEFMHISSLVTGAPAANICFDIHVIERHSGEGRRGGVDGADGAEGAEGAEGVDVLAHAMAYAYAIRMEETLRSMDPLSRSLTTVMRLTSYRASSTSHHLLPVSWPSWPLADMYRRLLLVTFHPSVLREVFGEHALAALLATPGFAIVVQSPARTAVALPISRTPVSFKLSKLGGLEACRGAPSPPRSSSSRSRSSSSSSASSSSSPSRSTGLSIALDSIARTSGMSQWEGVEVDTHETMDVGNPKLALFVRVMSRITDRIFIGSKLMAKNLEVLHHYGITHILNCAAVIIPEYFPRQFHYRSLFLFDGKQQDIGGVMYEVFDFLSEVERSGGRCLVHCEKGVSRSCSFVIAYLMHQRHESFMNISTLVKEHRPISQPNFGFTFQLLQWWTRITSEVTTPRVHRIVPDCRQRPHVCAARLEAKGSEATLDPRGVFVVHAPRHVWVWVGSYASQQLRDGGVLYAQQLERYEKAPGHEVLEQGAETDEFREALGGAIHVERVEKLTPEYELQDAPSHPILLRYPTWELAPLSLSSLQATSAFVLQNGMEVVVWKGEKVSSVTHDEIASRFMEGRSYPPPTTPIAIQVQGEEEAWFLAHFAS